MVFSKLTSKVNLHIHFQKIKNGGGEVEGVEFHAEGNTAIVTFEDANGKYFRKNRSGKNSDYASVYFTANKMILLSYFLYLC